MGGATGAFGGAPYEATILVLLLMYGITDVSRNGLHLDVTRCGGPARLSARPWRTDGATKVSRNGLHLHVTRCG